MTSPSVELADTTPVSLLDDVRATRAAIDGAEVRLVRLALAWADANPGDADGVLPAVKPFVEGAEAEAGDAVWNRDGAAQANDVDSYEWRGLPPVAYGAPEMFATANNMTSLAGLSFIRDALTLRHRLPGVWARVQAGHVPVWRARRIAQTVQGAADEIAAHVDVAATPIAHHIGSRKLESLYDEAMLELFPEERELAQIEALDHRHVTLHEHTYSHTGLVEMTIRGEWVDVHDFHQTLNQIAAVLKEQGSPDPVEVRRAVAVGILADPTHAAALLALEPDAAPVARRRVHLHVRLTDAALLGLDPAAYSHTHTGQVLEQTVREWCGRPEVDITISPLIDTTHHARTEAYRIPDGMAERVKARFPTCVFPHCQIPSQRCDLDHRIPYNKGGPTADENLYPLCRRHHRLKTFQPWRYTITWTDPTGHEYRSSPVSGVVP